MDKDSLDWLGIGLGTIAALVVVAFALLLGVPGLLLAAHVGGQIWSWYLLPLGLEQPPFVAFVGVSLLISLFWARNTPDRTPDPKPFSTMFRLIFLRLFGILMLWLVAWVLHFWLPA